MSFASEFKEFAAKGNVVDLAVGVIIGAAFGKIVDSLVKDLVMPVVGRIFGGLDFSNYFVVLAPPPPNYSGPMTYEALTKAGDPSAARRAADAFLAANSASPYAGLTSTCSPSPNPLVPLPPRSSSSMLMPTASR